MVYAIAAMLFGGLGSVAAFAIWFTSNRSKELGRSEAINEVQQSTIAATERADVVLNEHRTTSDTVDKLRQHNF